MSVASAFPHSEVYPFAMILEWMFGSDQFGEDDGHDDDEGLKKLREDVRQHSYFPGRAVPSRCWLAGPRREAKYLFGVHI